MKEVILAEKSGFCFGVNRAYETALEKSKDKNVSTYTFGPLIHNEEAISYLSEKGVDPLSIDDIHKLKNSNEIIIRSHGVTEDIEEMLKANIGTVIDCTCPYVKRIQTKAREYYQKGYQIVLVGNEKHPEIIGINGWCKNSAFITRDAKNVPSFDKDICILSQTTEKKEIWDKIVNAVKIANPDKEIIALNTICSATTERQMAAKELSQTVPAMIVIGGKASSNTKKLYEICSEYCQNTQLVSNVENINIDLLKNINKVGVTAGASTPKWIIDEIVDFISNL
ncbi:4-hydroxy-3-methylbut-2-enyl diphosphate reductase [Oceanirhabdus sp. W0125-5]|uniref:4-hydroxy-3-methylbut-2-enyl diphosphate reductase n=1 Tax=Oceanirhabdus sp. W0125-5 TaxID=2999116 RepID=UPI0022F2AD7C|nr:4-hydroxy-3-methylbut-2-enyl diphosphate reductase [Oceanirhabdus sp. W0125-5]WBW95101.1 4-hydroxy-3-methylbut-2-enyl diphosphate reductase [Oceanirhabdus sp. W0125-5]